MHENLSVGAAALRHGICAALAHAHAVTVAEAGYLHRIFGKFKGEIGAVKAEQGSELLLRDDGFANLHELHPAALRPSPDVNIRFGVR